MRNQDFIKMLWGLVAPMISMGSGGPITGGGATEEGMYPGSFAQMKSTQMPTQPPPGQNQLTPGQIQGVIPPGQMGQGGVDQDMLGQLMKLLPFLTMFGGR